VVDALLA